MIIPETVGMPCWYYDKKDLKVTPSIRDGIDFETERRYRKEGARFIIQCGTQMGLGHNTMATGVVYFHRFYMFHSFGTFPRYVTACCCLFLAGKVEETPKKCKDIIKTARGLLSDEKFVSFGDDPKEEVMTLERILLQTIKFDLQVEHPYSFLVKYAKCLKGDQTKLQKMVQMAWNFVNDSLSTTVCLQWEPEIIAVALIHLASKLSKFLVVDWIGRQPKHLRWWDMFVADVTMEILEDICHQVLDLYQQDNSGKDTGDSPPQLPISKSSPPVKRANISPKETKSSPIMPAVTPIKMSIDEKLEGAQIPKISTTDTGIHYNYQSNYGASMYPPTYAGPPPLQSLMQQQPIPTTIGQNQLYQLQQAQPPSHIPTHVYGGNSSGSNMLQPSGQYIPPIQNYYPTQQPPMHNRNMAGYYNGPT